MAEVDMYGTMSCPYCVRARELLDRKGVGYRWINVANNAALYNKMIRLSGGETVPQILINGQPIGGCDEMHALEHQGRLDALLGLS